MLLYTRIIHFSIPTWPRHRPLGMMLRYINFSYSNILTAQMYFDELQFLNVIPTLSNCLI